jgi:2',3'-cyclic-nucleotide 2'-phosphodiesterase (5'-nucleotidase family)
VLVSHNGMDVDVKMAERVPGLNAVFGGHTHDGVPKPLKVKNAGGGECWVTNAGSNGKFVGCMDMAIEGVGNVVVNVDASGSRVQGDQPNAKALGSAIGAAVQAEPIKQKRPGGLLS